MRAPRVFVGRECFSAMNFAHRRGWVGERIKQRAAIFAIDIAAYVVMRKAGERKAGSAKW
jgi:hypothetical protein